MRLAGAHGFADVARDGEEFQGLAIIAEDRRDHHIPPAPGTLGGGRQPGETADAALPRRLDGGGHLMALLLGPEVGPEAALEGNEVIDLHDHEAARIHVFQAPFQIDQLDAVDAADHDAALEGLALPEFGFMATLRGDVQQYAAGLAPLELQAAQLAIGALAPGLPDLSRRG